MKDWVYRLDHDAVGVAESRLPAPVLTFVGGRQWRLEEDYEYRDGATTITVPAGSSSISRRCRVRSGG